MPRTRLASVIAPFALLAATLASAVAVAAPSFTLTGVPASPFVSTGIRGLSADGRSAAGISNGFGTRGFLWTAEGGRSDFGLSIAQTTDVRGISGDGVTAVGVGGTVGSPHAFSWTQANGYRSLGTAPGFSRSIAVDANHDGSIIVGTLDNGTGTPQEAFRWTQSGGMLALGNNTRANAISGDGNVIIGELGSTPRAFAWTETGGMQFLSSLGGTGGSYALATNNTGNIIAGLSGQFLFPTLWIDGSPMQMIGELFTPRGVSNNGQVVVGQTISGDGRAAIWTPATGAIRLEDYLTANGVVVPANVDLGSCIGVSSDGLTFAGTIGNGELPRQGWVATILPPCPADLDNDGSFTNGGARDRAVTIDDLLYFLTGFEAGSTLIDLDNGSNTGTPDNAVTIDDLLYFLTHFEAGC